MRPWIFALVLGFVALPALACDKPRQMDGFKTCADVEKAFEEGALVHYSPDPETEMANYLTAFRKAFPKIQTSFMRLQTGALYARLLAERQAKSYIPDTLILTEIGFALDLQKRGGYAQYMSPEAAFYTPAQQSKPAGFWTWDNVIPAGIAYNTTQLTPEQAPKSYKALLNPLWADSVNTKLSTSGLQHLAWYSLRRLYGDDFWKKFGELRPRGFDSYVQQFDRMVSGQDKVVATAQYSGYLIAKAKGAPVAFVVPEEGIIATPGVMGVMDHAPHPNAARLFLDWYLGVPGQTIMTQTIKNYSARTDVPPPPGGVPITDFKLIVPDDWDAFLKTHSQFVKEWDKMVGMR
jgi:iron(III) transport system substrate-binding protein